MTNLAVWRQAYALRSDASSAIQLALKLWLQFSDYRSKHFLKHIDIIVLFFYIFASKPCIFIEEMKILLIILDVENKVQILQKILFDCPCSQYY